jgi:hypothetical protein
VIIYYTKQSEGAPSAAALSIILCAIASIGATSFTGDGLSSTQEREAEARRYTSVPLATVGRTIAINGPAVQDANSLSKKRGRPAQFDLATSAERNTLCQLRYGA